MDKGGNCGRWKWRPQMDDDTGKGSCIFPRLHFISKITLFFLNLFFSLLYSKGIKLSLHVYISPPTHPLFCCNNALTCRWCQTTAHSGRNLRISLPLRRRSGLKLECKIYFRIVLCRFREMASLCTPDDQPEDQ